METTQERLLNAVESGSQDALYEFARNDVLFPAFERDEIDYYCSDGVRYESATVMPSKLLDKLWFYVEPTMMGHKVKVGSNYHCLGVRVDEDRITQKPIGRADSVPVVVLFRAVAYVDHHGCVIDPSVTIAERPTPE